jgi:hypothetical protein
MLKKIICIDGDWLIFSIACTAEELYIEASLNTEENSVKEYSNITELKNLLDSDFKTIRDNYTIKDCKRLKKDYFESMATCKFAINARIKKILKQTKSTDYIIALGGSTNFRVDLPLPRKYKGDRDDKQRPLLLKPLREWLLESKPCVISENEEADDIVSKYQYLGSKGIQDNTEYLACTIDKDARGTTGKVYHPIKEEVLDISGIGFIRLDVKESGKSKKYSIYGEGRKWLYYQIVMGDPVDDYNPLDLLHDINCKSNLVGRHTMTPYKFYHLFKDCNTDQECWKTITDIYKEWYANLKWWYSWNGSLVHGDWVDFLQMYVDVAFMRRWDNDRLDVKTLLTKYNLI